MLLFIPIGKWKDVDCNVVPSETLGRSSNMYYMPHRETPSYGLKFDKAVHEIQEFSGTTSVDIIPVNDTAATASLAEDSEVQFMGFGAPVAPHSRDCCPEFLFDKRIPSPANLRACDNCYCKFCLVYYQCILTALTYRCLFRLCV